MHYLIQNCSLSVGDDNIAVKAGSTFCGDIVITRCFFGTGHGLSIGGQTNAGLDGMTVTDCSFEGTTSGLRMKADPTQGGPVRNVSYSNIRMKNVTYPIVFYSYYNQVGSPGATSGSNETTTQKVATWNNIPPNPLGSSTLPLWQNITIDNLSSTGSTGYSIIWGLPLAQGFVSNVTFNNLSHSGAVGLKIFNAQNVQFTGTTVIDVPGAVPSVTVVNGLGVRTQPKGQVVDLGASALFTVRVLGGGAPGEESGYQWLFNGAPLADGVQSDGTVVSGANTARLNLSSIQLSHAGKYSVTVNDRLSVYDTSTSQLTRSAAVSVTSSAAELEVNDPAAPAKLFALSCRAQVGTGDNVLIPGFAVGGSGSRQVVVRVGGPAIQGVAGTLAQPRMELHQVGVSQTVASNAGWSSGSASATAALQEAFTLAGLPQYAEGSADCALLTTLQAGAAYTVVVNGVGGGTGVALVELYEVGPGKAHMTALSCRAQVGTNDGVLIPGIVVRGSNPKRMLIRASAPTGVAGVLSQPSLGLYDQTGAKIAENTHWGTAANASDIFAVTPSCGLVNFAANSADCAILMALAPGNYTAQVRGVNNSTGVALIEVYEVP